MTEMPETALQATTPPRERSSRLPYSPALDGVRALAVIAVLLYHGGMPWLPGGFLGVEIFFTISGYLITSLLLSEWRQTNHIVLKHFWLRRARRLLPALFLVIVASLAYAVLFLPEEVASLRGDAAAAFGYSTNWYLILSHQSYFEAVGRPSLLRHLWSLAVEEQFYVLWPLLFVLTMRRWRARHVLLGVLAVATSSALLMALLYQPGADPSRVYYGTDTRAAGILIGVALAFVWTPGQCPKLRGMLSPGRADRLPMNVIGFAALAALVLFCLFANEFDPFLYRGGFALVALSTAALIATVVHPRGRIVAAALGSPVLVWIGLRSYGIYLWHWPVFLLTRPQLDVPLAGLPLFAIRLAVTVALAMISYRLIEIPMRSGALGRAWSAWRRSQGAQRRWLAAQWSSVTVAILALSIALGACVVRAQPPAPPDYLAEASLAATAIPTPVPTLEVGNAPGASATPQAPIATVETPIVPTPMPVLLSTETPTAEPSVTPAPEATPQSLEDAPTRQTPDPGDDIPTRVAVTRAATPTPVAPTAMLSVTLTSRPSGTPTAAPGPATRPSIPTITPVVSEHITAIGDSVMLGAAPVLRQAFSDIEVDAVQGRQLFTVRDQPGAVEQIKARHVEGRLGPIVVLHLGNNGVFSAENLDQIMQTLADRRRVIVLNVRVPREWETYNNNVLTPGVKKYSNAVLVDWRAATASRSDVLWGDGMHVKPEGALFYAELIAHAITAP